MADYLVQTAPFPEWQLLASWPIRPIALGCLVPVRSASSRKETVIARPHSQYPIHARLLGDTRSRRAHGPGGSRPLCPAEYPAEIAVLDTLAADRPVTGKSTRAMGLGGRA